MVASKHLSSRAQPCISRADALHVTTTPDYTASTAKSNTTHNSAITACMLGSHPFSVRVCDACQSPTTDLRLVSFKQCHATAYTAARSTASRLERQLPVLVPPKCMHTEHKLSTAGMHGSQSQPTWHRQTPQGYPQPPLPHHMATQAH